MNQLTQKQQVRSTYVPERAKDMVDRIFENLTASCPILLTISGEQLDILKQQWILGFAENEIKTFEQVKRGMAAARAKPNGYLPSVGEFIGWCKAGNKYAHLAYQAPTNWQDAQRRLWGMALSWKTNSPLQATSNTG